VRCQLLIGISVGVGVSACCPDPPQLRGHVYLSRGDCDPGGSEPIGGDVGNFMVVATALSGSASFDQLARCSSGAFAIDVPPGDYHILVEALTNIGCVPWLTRVTGKAELDVHDVTGPTDVGTVILDGHDYGGC
jgi:hypothetical protein